MKIKKELNDNQRLVIFCSGWASEPNLFCRLNSFDIDLIFLYDYTGLSNISNIREFIDIGKILRNHIENYLITWSFGVGVGYILFEKYRKFFNKIIAINGTTLPINKYYGISPSIFYRTLNSLSKASYKRFIDNMLINERAKIFFESHKQDREFESIKNELKDLADIFTNFIYRSPFITDMIISQNDKIFPVDSMERYAFDYGIKNLFYLDAPHFPFYLFNDWNGIIKL